MGRLAKYKQGGMLPKGMKVLPSGEGKKAHGYAEGGLVKTRGTGAATKGTKHIKSA